MAKRVIWTLTAQNDRKEILQYWIDRNQSKAYSRKLNQLIRETIKLIAKYPQIGRATDIEKVRAKLLKDYYIFYQVEEVIIILSIWDTRQDPIYQKTKKT